MQAVGIALWKCDAGGVLPDCKCDAGGVHCPIGSVVQVVCIANFGVFYMWCVLPNWKCDAGGVYYLNGSVMRLPCRWCGAKLAMSCRWCISLLEV